MTEQEAIRIGNELLMQSMVGGEDAEERRYCDFICKAIEALEQADKYKWHSLKDNPKDLPTEHMILACICRKGSTPYYDIIYYGKPYGVHPKPKGKVFYSSDSEWGDYVIDDVIAWKYIEEFSEVEE